MKMSDVSCEVSFAEYVSECVKNHDRLEKENAELREALQQMVEQFECEHNCEYEFKLIKASKKLLNK